MNKLKVALFLIVIIPLQQTWADDPVLFIPGSVLENSLSDYNHIPFITVHMQNANLLIANHIDSVLKSSKYTDAIFVTQFVGGQMLAKAQWSDNHVTEGSRWLLVADNSRSERNGSLVDEYASDIVRCLQSMDSLSSTFTPLYALLSGVRLESATQLSQAVTGAKQLIQLYNNGDCTGGGNQAVFDRDILKHGISINLTGKGLDGYFIGSEAIIQQKALFDEIFYGHEESKGFWYFSSIKLAKDFIRDLATTMVGEELNDILLNDRHYQYGSFLDLAVLLKIERPSLDPSLLINIADACLDGTVNSIFRKDFSLSECIATEGSSSYSIQFENKKYFHY